MSPVNVRKTIVGSQMADKPKKLTIKQAKFVKAYVDNDGNGTKAALQTYDVKNENSAHAIASENLQKPTIQEAIDNAMVKLNITPELTIAPVAEALIHEDLDMRLKGHDRAVKLMTLSQKTEKEGGNTFNFIKADNANFNAGKYVD